MNEPKNDGGPAFPQPFLTDGEGRLKSPGITLRDFFAVAALMGQIAYRGIPAVTCHGAKDSDYEAEAKTAYRLADALLAERKNP